MKTFVARFVRPSGAIGVIHIMASSSVCAMLEVMNKERDATGLNVQPCRLAALLTNYPNAGSADKTSSDSVDLPKATIRSDSYSGNPTHNKRFGNVQES
jgi:hypothetical protein